MSGTGGLARLEPLAHRYLDAKQEVIRAGFADEIDWQADRGVMDPPTEAELLTEAAWVVLNSGMRERVIRRLFPRLCEAFFGFESALAIAENAEVCRDRAREVFNHPMKVEAIIEFARRTVAMGSPGLLRRLEEDGADFLLSFPYFGPATSRHLGKNLGLDIAKPDRHLLRLASAAGFSSPQQMCEVVSSLTGDRVAVVDIVLWRFATLNHDYEHFFGRAHELDA